MTPGLPAASIPVPGRQHAPRRWPFYSPEAVARVAEMVSHGRTYASGPDEHVQRLEERFAALHRPAGQALFFGSGTAALLAAYFALDLSPGAEVLAPTNTFRATVTPLLPLGLRPVLCDADPVTGNLDLTAAAARLSPRTEAIVVTHLWGHPLDLGAVRRFADTHHLALVEDASHAHGAHWEGVPVGSAGDVAVFSTGTKKLVSGGMGGLLLSSSADVIRRAVVLGHPKPLVERYTRGTDLAALAGIGLGFNLRGTPSAAVLALDHLDRLDTTITVKNANLRLLADAIQECLPGLQMPMRDARFSRGTLYAVRAHWSDPNWPAQQVLDLLAAEGVPVERQGTPLHRHQIMTDGGTSLFRWTAATSSRPLNDPAGFPAADALHEQVIGWDTRELYDPAAEVIGSWQQAFGRVAARLATPHRRSRDGHRSASARPGTTTSPSKEGTA